MPFFKSSQALRSSFVTHNIILYWWNLSFITYFNDAKFGQYEYIFEIKIQIIKKNYVSLLL
jgi:hypothetical protein